MKRFVAHYADKVIGVLSGFDRLLFRGTLKGLGYVAGMIMFLNVNHVLRKKFKEYVQRSTERLKETSLAAAKEQGRPVVYLSSTKIDKEAEARKIAERDHIKDGLICVLGCVEPCTTYRVFGDRSTNEAELKSHWTRCLHLYHYMNDPVFGFMHVRLQTWLPYSAQVYINGREWLARLMDREGIRYERRDNCFPWIEDMDRAKELVQQQRSIRWERELDRVTRMANPSLKELLGNFESEYRWSLWQSEWATDVMFKSPKDLAAIYRPLVLHGITTFGSDDVMRFLGQKAHGLFQGEIVSDFRNRPEGICIHHRVGANSVKMYDKQGSILRVETTIHDPAGIKVFRRKQGEPKGERAMLPMRKGIADLKRRTDVSQASNDRYLDALASADTTTAIGTLVQSVARPVRDRKGRRFRALRAWDAEDLKLFRAISRGEFAIRGLRNRDLQAHLFSCPPTNYEEGCRRTAKVSRVIRMLRAHGLLRKVPRDRLYRLTEKARDFLAAILSVQDATPQALAKIRA